MKLFFLIERVFHKRLFSYTYNEESENSFKQTEMVTKLSVQITNSLQLIHNSNRRTTNTSPLLKHHQSIWSMKAIKWGSITKWQRPGFKNFLYVK